MRATFADGFRHMIPVTRGWVVPIENGAYQSIYYMQYGNRLKVA